MIEGSKSVFTKEEYQEILSLVKEKELAPPGEQKRIRDKIRDLGFYWNNYSSHNKGYTTKDLNNLMANGILSYTGEYTIITENDISKWDDKTGDLYHFPSRYLKYLKAGTKVLYYKGRMTDSKFIHKRLSKDPHYFGTAIVTKVFKDTSSSKNDYYAELKDFELFAKAIPFKKDNDYLEEVNRSNYWRDNAVRPISRKVYSSILTLSGATEKLYADELQGKDEAFDILVEGGKKKISTTVSERNPTLRKQAINIHGLSCQVCGFNFKERYGEVGEGFIHVHHLNPISQTGKTKVNPEKDLSVLCANCHSMVHRKRDEVMSLEELKRRFKPMKK